MNRADYSHNSQTGKKVRIATNLLFAIYTFLFLFQGFHEQLEVYSHAYSRLLHLSVSIPVWIISVLTTALLIGIQALARSGFNISTRYLFLSYIPSLIGLYLFIRQKDDSYDEHQMFLQHSILLGLAGLLLVVQIFRYVLTNNETNKRESYSISTWSITHLILFSISFFFIGLFSPMKQSVRSEAAMIQALQDKNYDLVLQLEGNTAVPTLKMTRLRNQALLQKGILHTHLFHYPQLYAAQGLDVDLDNSNLSDSSHLAIQLTDTEIRCIRSLLDKNLESFVAQQSRYFQQSTSAQPQDLYTEAYAMYVYKHPEKSAILCDSALQKRFIHYLQFRNRYIRSNFSASEIEHNPYKNTYWWYYDFVTSEKSN